MMAKTQMAVLGTDVGSWRVLRTASSFQDSPISPFVATPPLLPVCPSARMLRLAATHNIRILIRSACS